MRIAVLLFLLPLLVFGGEINAEAPVIRCATYNASLNRSSSGLLAIELMNPNANSFNITNIKRVAQTIQRVSPDVVVINEFDFDVNDVSLELFHDNFLAVSQAGQPALDYPYRYTAPSNTGVHSGFDLDNNGSIVSNSGSTSYGNDAFGFGVFEGQFGMAVYSRYPIQEANIRTFQHFLWKDMPGALLPPGYYSAAELEVFRLSSKSHWDVPIEVSPGVVVHLLVSHPTPPVFDGSEDRNGRRNHDEIRLWADYVDPAAGGYLVDDAGQAGGLAPGARFVIFGDQNADPLDGDSVNGAIQQLLDHPAINASLVPSSQGGVQQATSQGGANLGHSGNPAHDTADFGDFGSSSGNLRVDYVLPSVSGFEPLDGVVFWPPASDPTFALVAASDHRLVFMDLELVPLIEETVFNLEIRTSGDGQSVELTWTGAPDLVHTLEYSGDLENGPWVSLPEIPVVMGPSPGQFSATDLAVSGRFYRVKVSYP